MKNTIPLYLIAVGIACIGLQNAGIIKPYKISETSINGSIELKNPVFGRGLDVNIKNIVLDVNVKNLSDITDEQLQVNVANASEIGDEVSLRQLNVNISSIADQNIVNSKIGSTIGFKSTQNTILPINWGEISISR